MLLLGDRRATMSCSRHLILEAFPNNHSSPLTTCTSLLPSRMYMDSSHAQTMWCSAAIHLIIIRTCPLTANHHQPDPSSPWILHTHNGLRVHAPQECHHTWHSCGCATTCVANPCTWSDHFESLHKFQYVEALTRHFTHGTFHVLHLSYTSSPSMACTQIEHSPSSNIVHTFLATGSVCVHAAHARATPAHLPMSSTSRKVKIVMRANSGRSSM